MANKMNKNLLLMDKSTKKEIKVKGYPEEKIEQIKEQVPDRITDDNKVKFYIRALSDGELEKSKEVIFENLNISKEVMQDMNTEKIKRMKDKGASDKEIEKALQKELGNQGIEVDVGKMRMSSKKSTYSLCAMGLSTDEEDWSIDEVKKLPNGIPDQIADEIRSISTFKTQNEDEGKN